MGRSVTLHPEACTQPSGQVTQADFHDPSHPIDMSGPAPKPSQPGCQPEPHVRRAGCATRGERAPRAPIRVWPGGCGRGWPLHGVTATREFESLALAAEPDAALMRRAGAAVARWALAMRPHARTWWVAVGPGGNGGDGSFAAARLAKMGLDVRLSVHADPGRLPDDARRGLAAAEQAGVRVMSSPTVGEPPDAIIDALLGIGVSRPPEGRVLQGIEAIGGSAAPCLSIDLPSGLDADTGRTLGQKAVTAAATLSLLTLKPGLFTGAGRRHAGQVWLESLGWDAPCAQGAAACGPSALLLGSQHEQPAWSVRTEEQHKGHFGDAVVIGGAAGMPGAARLAAHAALAAGAGRTFLVSLDAAAPAGDPLRPELMCRRPAALQDEAWLGQSTVVCGCGGGTAVAESLPQVLRHAARLVLDADALNAIARDPALQSMLQGRSAAGRWTVMTPHPLEAARLLGCSTADVQADRYAAAAELSRRWQCTAVLKGSGTLVDTPGLMPAVNPTGGPMLATAGTGDVLAGWIGGLWAQAPQGCGSERERAHEAACASVWRHGRAAESGFLGMPSGRALDLIEAMRSSARREFGDGRPCPT